MNGDTNCTLREFDLTEFTAIINSFLFLYGELWVFFESIQHLKIQNILETTDEYRLLFENRAFLEISKV
jgi:hypothetical protein